MKNILIWRMRLLFQISFLSLSFRFSRPVYCGYLLPVIFFLFAVKRLVLIMGKAGKRDPDQLKV